MTYITVKAARAQKMHRSIDGHNPYNLLILTIDNSINFTTEKLLTIESMEIFKVKSIYILINGQFWIYQLTNVWSNANVDWQLFMFVFNTLGPYS